ncbi:hypothetical protein PHET_11797 [Paragonimus heterotremus]|uniref:Uncharacterized protein n=1 Tax=Paragonimus heterotremus TaxID=100268 RepID=A0A8J4SPY4_9TREM|nr:hypothetical protein PHET_11797 [Paragonimus heterotremus]
MCTLLPARRLVNLGRADSKIILFDSFQMEQMMSDLILDCGGCWCVRIRKKLCRKSRYVPYLQGGGSLLQSKSALVAEIRS